MPDADDPNQSPNDTVEEAIRRDDDFAVRQIRKLRDRSARLRKALQPPQSGFGATTEGSSGIGVVSMDVRDLVKELSPSRWRKADLQGRCAKISSASANTKSRSNPFPFEISRSPRASSLRMWRSFSERSNDSGLIMIAAARPRWVMTTGWVDRRTRFSTAAAS